MKIQVIIPAGGLGKRFGGVLPKSLVLFKKKPLIVHCLKIFQQCKAVDSIVIAVPKKFKRRFEVLVKRWRIYKVKRVVAGGDTRSASVYQGLNATDADTDMVIVHDAARPLVSLELLKRCILSCQKYGAAVAAVPVKPTIKRIHLKSQTVIETLKREELWEIQTPQVFKRSLLREAYLKAKNKNVTDCAALVEQIGKKVKIVMGDYKNIKVTTKEDLKIASVLY